ncbi:MAG: sulfite exporter TauE/SafE family protein [Bacteriovoracia bacterium]
MINEELFVGLLSVLAGFIDSIAGGGGLITIPMWTLVMGPGASVVATNKVGAFASSAMALWVYQRRHKLEWRRGLWFLVSISLGSLCGAQLTGLVPAQLFAWLLLALCPFILWIVWSRERLFAERPAQPISRRKLVCAGVLVGAYDGFFGPGGGTFMLLSLLVLTQMPLMAALALSKLANALSAGVSLASFSAQGLVDWRWGVLGGASIVLGSFLGARLASKRAVTVVRPALTVVVLLLMAKVAWDLTRA